MKKIILGTVFAVSLFSHAAFAGLEEGKRYFENKEWPKAIAELSPLADAGDEQAMMMMATIYLDGLGVQKNSLKALEYYKRAAMEKNNLDAMVAIGAAYQSGKLNVEKNPKIANAWFARAAEMGDPTGAFFFAITLFQGDLTQKTDFVRNPVAAYKWFLITSYNQTNRRFANAGREMAQMARGRLTFEQINLAQKEAKEWRPKTAKDFDSFPLMPMPEISLPDMPAAGDKKPADGAAKPAPAAQKPAADATPKK